MVRNKILSANDAIDDIVFDNLFDGDGVEEDDEGFTAAERFPLNVAASANNPHNPLETIDKERYTTVKGHSETRWHSVLESLGSQRVAVNRVFCQLKNPISVLSREWDDIHDLIHFLKIFRDAVEMFS